MAKVKLSLEAKRLVRRLIIAGYSNGVIRAELRDAGHPSDIGDSGLSYYRRSAKVQEALEALDLEAAQVGLALRSRRIAELNTLAQECLDRARGVVQGHSDLPRMPVPMLAYIALGREFRDYVTLISKLVDNEAASRTRVTVPLAGAGAETRNSAAEPFSEAFVLAMFADGLESYVASMKTQGQAGEGHSRLEE